MPAVLASLKNPKAAICENIPWGCADFLLLNFRHKVQKPIKVVLNFREETEGSNCWQTDIYNLSHDFPGFAINTVAYNLLYGDINAVSRHLLFPYPYKHKECNEVVRHRKSLSRCR
ncbi:UNVERIFIED_CONTAM: hypothetical protein K2H54_055312 [Gekko kuhli]